MTRRRFEVWAVVAFVAVAALAVLHYVFGPWASLALVVTVAVAAAVVALIVHPAPVWWAWVALRWVAACRACDLGRKVKPWHRRRNEGEVLRFHAARAWWTSTDHGVRIRVRVPHGMTSTAVLDLAPAMAGVLRGVRSWGQYVDEHRAEVHVIFRDVLKSVRPSIVHTLQGVTRWARDEAGCDLVWSPAAGHTAVQGTTGSGKSSTVYTLLRPLAGRADVLVCGSDISGLVLAPWRARAPHLIAVGGEDLEAHAVALERIVDVMTDRLADLVTSGRDLLTPSPDTPWLVVVLEEAPGLFAAAKVDKDVHARITTAVRRIKMEGRKVRVIALTSAQRMTASVVDSDARSQESVRISHRVDTDSALRLLHDGANLPTLEEVRQWPAGYALAEQPGRRLCRVRVDFTTYEQYRADVTAAVGTMPTVVPDLADTLELEPVPTATPAPRRHPKQPRRRIEATA